MKVVQYTVWDFIEGLKHPANTCLLLLAFAFSVSFLVWRQGRFPDSGGRVLGRGDLDAGYRDPQLEEGTFQIQNLFALPYQKKSDSIIPDICHFFYTGKIFGE